MWRLGAPVYWTCGLLQFLIAISNQESKHEVVELQLDEERSIESPGFPFDCCNPISYTIHFLGTGSKAYIRLVFTDLDLEPGSSLLLYDGPDESSPLFPYQPELYGRPIKNDGDLLAWYREGVQSRGRHIHVKYIPKTDGFKTNWYTGFKANFWTTDKPKSSWNNWPTSELCPYLRPSKQGGILSLRPNHRYLKPSDTASPMLDCTWQIKPPRHNMQGAKVFVRIAEIHFSGKGQHSGEKFSIEMHNGTSSSGRPFFQYDRYNSQPSDIKVEESFLSRSGDGLYIHLRVPTEMKDFHVRIIYGYYLPKDECSPQAGWDCEPTDMCVPISNMCDQIPQCSDNSDEINSKCLTMAKVDLKRSSMSPKYMRKPTDKAVTRENWYCERGLKCPDGTCRYDWDTCDECPHYTKTCRNKDCIELEYRCREDQCPEHRPFQCDGGNRCLFSDYVCDGTCECEDCTDENNCASEAKSDFMSLLWPSVIGITIPIILCIIPLAYFIHRSRKRGDAYRETVPTSSPDVGGEFGGADHFPMNAGANMSFPAM